MLKKRIIPCLDVKDGRTVKGIQFENLIDAGDAVALAHQYSSQGADELVFLDIAATQEERATISSFAQNVAQKVSIPFTIGGGIASVEHAKQVILAGADKVGINSAAIKNPNLISDLASAFGAQAVVVAIDAKKTNTTVSGWEVMIAGGKISTGADVVEWASECEQKGAGEILLTSIDCDGAKQGFDIPLLLAVQAVVSIPLIASGGAGKKEHFLELFTKTNATGALAASVFHFGIISIQELKNYLRDHGVALR